MKGVSWQEGSAPPQEGNQMSGMKSMTGQEYIRRISDRAYILEGSLSEVENSPPHNLDTPHRMVAGNTHTYTHTHGQDKKDGYRCLKANHSGL